jgi:hypothetical protein
MKGYKKARYQNIKEQVEKEVTRILKIKGIDIDNDKNLYFNDIL